MYSQKGDFLRFVCIRIAAAVDKINKMADCRLSRLEGKQGIFCFFIIDCTQFITLGTKIDGKVSVKHRPFIDLLILDVINLFFFFVFLFFFLFFFVFYLSWGIYTIHSMQAEAKRTNLKISRCKVSLLNVFVFFGFVK